MGDEHTQRRGPCLCGPRQPGYLSPTEATAALRSGSREEGALRVLPVTSALAAPTPAPSLHHPRSADPPSEGHELAEGRQRPLPKDHLRTLGEMTSGIAHDFNNALMLILGFSELLLTRPGALRDEASAREYLQLMHTAAEDAAQLV